jgi:glycosyltransferase involved in cell wall biosynthesis
MAKKKVLHLTQATGGVKTYVAHVFDHADLNAFEFVVAAPADVFFEAYCKQKGIPYYVADLERGMNPIATIKLLIKMIKIIKKEQPSVIHAHSAKGGFIGRVAARLTRTKIIYTPHAFSYLSFVGFKRMFFYLLEYLVRGWTDLLLAISYTEANCARYQLGYPKEKVKVILNAVPTQQTDLQNYNYEVKRIGMIGRLTIQKNPLQFLEIAQQLVAKYPKLQFSILGAGIHDDLKTEIDQYIAQHALAANVTIKNWGDVNTSAAFLKETDIYLSTSIFEGLPFSLLDAMLCGIPCVVTKVEGNTDVIHNGENGFSCLSLQEFCERIELLINNWELRQKIGKGGRAYILANHNVASTIKNLEEIYNSF